jgi:hypothetical protein
MISQEVMNRVHNASREELEAGLKNLLEQCAKEDAAMKDPYRRYLHTMEIYRLLVAGLSQ